MLREMRRSWGQRRGGRGGTIQLAVHSNNSAREWYERLGMEACRWWERGGTGWELKGEGLYVPEEPAEGAGAEGGLIMRSSGGALDSALRRRYEQRGDGAGDISYHIIKGGISEMRTRGLLKGVRAMANRVYAGQRWWVEGNRSHIECLYRRQSRACPTLFIIAVAGGGTADRATGEEAEHWEEAETHNEEAVATTRLNATEGSSRADGGGRRQRTGDG